MTYVAFRYFCVVFAIFISLPTTSATAQDSIIFGTEIYAPYNYVDKRTGRISGFSYDVVKALINHVGDQEIAEVKVYPWARIYYMAQHLENVAIFSMVHSEARDKKFKWVGVLYYPDAFIWKLSARTDIKIKNKADLQQYKTVVLNDGIDEQILTRWYGLTSDEHLLTIAGNDQKVLMLTSGRAELFEYGELALRWKMSLMGLDFSLVEKVMPIPEMTSLSLAFSLKTSDEIVNRYRQALREIKTNGVYQAILNKWRIPEKAP